MTVRQWQFSTVGGKGSWVGSGGGVSSNKPSTGGGSQALLLDYCGVSMCRELGSCLAGCIWSTLAAKWLNGDGEISRTMLDGGGHGRVEHQAICGVRLGRDATGKGCPDETGGVCREALSARSDTTSDPSRWESASESVGYSPLLYSARMFASAPSPFPSRSRSSSPKGQDAGYPRVMPQPGSFRRGASLCYPGYWPVTHMTSNGKQVPGLLGSSGPVPFLR